MTSSQANGTSNDTNAQHLPEIKLVPADLDDPSQYETLHSQRLTCGWNHDTAYLTNLRNSIQRKERTLFWITLPSLLSPHSNAGHVSLDLPTQKDSDYGFGPSILSHPSTKISMLFITPAARELKLKLGDRTMALLERMSTEPDFGRADCRYVYVDALSKRYTREEGPENRGIWQRLGLRERARDEPCTQEWFDRRGYKAYHSKPHYANTALDGNEVKLEAVFMRKEVGSGAG